MHGSFTTFQQIRTYVSDTVYISIPLLNLKLSYLLCKDRIIRNIELTWSLKPNIVAYRAVGYSPCMYLHVCMLVMLCQLLSMCHIFVTQYMLHVSFTTRCISVIHYDLYMSFTMCTSITSYVFHLPLSVYVQYINDNPYVLSFTCSKMCSN